jgi:hypothetical protein
VRAPMTNTEGKEAGSLSRARQVHTFQTEVSRKLIYDQILTYQCIIRIKKCRMEASGRVSGIV